MGTLEINLPPQPTTVSPKGESSRFIPPVEAEFHQALEDAGPEQRSVGEFSRQRRGTLPRTPDLLNLERPDGDHFQGHLNGVAYLSEVEADSSEKQASQYIARMFALQGTYPDIHYAYHELTITADDVLNTVLSYVEAYKQSGSQPLVRFQMIDPRAKAFFYDAEGEEVRLASAITGVLTHVELFEAGEAAKSTTNIEPELESSSVSVHADFTFERS